MVYAVLTAVLFSFSMFFATRSTRAVGVERATLARILFAVTVLGLWAAIAGAHLPRACTLWLLASGIVGMGLGDVALFYAIARCGGRLTAILAQCSAVPLAVAIEWLWLGQTIDLAHLAVVFTIVAGLGLSLSPDRTPERGPAVSPLQFWLGVAAGVGSALGMALGAVLTRRAIDSLPPGAAWDGGTAAFYRMVTGALTTLVFYRPVLGHWHRTLRARPSLPAFRRYRHTVANALCGSVLGVAVMQQALLTVPAGVVMAVVSTAPIGTMVLLWAIEHHRPTPRAAIGALVAVGGVVALQLMAATL